MTNQKQKKTTYKRMKQAIKSAFIGAALAFAVAGCGSRSLLVEPLADAGIKRDSQSNVMKPDAHIVDSSLPFSKDKGTPVSKDSTSDTKPLEPLCVPRISPGSLPAYGNDQAHVKVIVFGGYECPFTGKIYSDTELNLRQEYVAKDKAVIYFRDFTLPFHDKSDITAQGARCANEQGKFWSMHDMLFANWAQ